MIPHLEVVSSGLSTTVQDLGRFGHQAQGVPASGALDFGNFRLANALVGNEERVGALELRILGPTLKVVASSVRIALTGTNAAIELVGPESRSIPAHQSVTLVRDQVFRIGHVSDSAVCYLAVEGGFDLPSLYDSQSTCVSAGMGGVDGRALKAGDCLRLCNGSASERPESICSRPLQYADTTPLRVVLGPQADYFSPEGLQTFLGQTYSLTPDASRMGVRLTGPEIAHEKGADINSDGIVTGAIQVPGNGLPIILLADHQTTGGYPKIAVVASADIPRLGRMTPGSMVSFAAVDVMEAETARRDLERQVLSSIAAIEPMTDLSASLDSLLLSSNLISGVVFE